MSSTELNHVSNPISDQYIDQHSDFEVSSPDDKPVDLDFLTPEERDVILEVLARDENLKRKEHERIDRLKKEIRDLRAEEFSRISFDASRLCGRCLEEFSWLFNKGQVCSKCRLRVCKKCRQLLNNKTWMCLVCLRILELETQTGSWFYTDYPQNKKNMSSCQIISAIDLLRSSLSNLESPDANDTSKLNGRFGNHVTSMTELPSVTLMTFEEDEDFEKFSDSDSLFNKFLSSSTPNLSIKSPTPDRGSLTNLFIADARELQDDLPPHTTETLQHYDNVFQSDPSIDEKIDSTLINGGSSDHVNFGDSPTNGHDDDDLLQASDANEIAADKTKLFCPESREVKIIVAEEDDSQNEFSNSQTPVARDDGRNESTSEETTTSTNTASDAVRLKVSALLAKYGRQDVTTSYSTIYESVLNTTPNNDADIKQDKRYDSSPDLPLISQTSPKKKNEFFSSDEMAPQSPDRKHRSAGNSPPLRPSPIEDKSPVVEGGDEEDDDDPIRRFWKNEALLQKQGDCGFSSAVSWVKSGGYDLDWEASDEEAPFSIQDFDHVSTGFLDDDDDEETKGTFSDLRSVINNILRQSPHDAHSEDYEDEREEEERGDTILLPISSSLPTFRTGAPMLRKKSLSVISEHTEPSACSSFDESSFLGEFPDDVGNPPSEFD